MAGLKNSGLRRDVWEDWSVENAVGRMMKKLLMYTERHLDPQCGRTRKALSACHLREVRPVLGRRTLQAPGSPAP